MTIGAFALLVLTPYAAIASASSDEDAVKAVLSDYKQALERLDGAAPAKLFAPDAEVFESGKREGGYQEYLAHHLGPELVEFASFRFNNYSAVVRIEGDVAIASESKAMSPSLPSHTSTGSCSNAASPSSVLASRRVF